MPSSACGSLSTLSPTMSDGFYRCNTFANNIAQIGSTSVTLAAFMRVWSLSAWFSLLAAADAHFSAESCRNVNTIVGENESCVARRKFCGRHCDGVCRSGCVDVRIANNSQSPKRKWWWAVATRNSAKVVPRSRKSGTLSTRVPAARESSVVRPPPDLFPCSFRRQLPAFATQIPSFQQSGSSQPQHPLYPLFLRLHST